MTRKCIAALNLFSLGAKRYDKGCLILKSHSLHLKHSALFMKIRTQCIQKGRVFRSFEFIISDKRNDNYDQWFHKLQAPLLALFDKFLCNMHIC